MKGANIVDSTYIEAAEKTMKLIEILAANAGDLTVTQIAKYLDCSISSANRFLQTLQKSGYVNKNNHTKRYELTYKINAVSYVNLQKNPDIQKLIPIANAVSQNYDISVNINTVANGSAMLIYRVANTYNKDLDFLTGQVAPAYCTSSGKVILSTFSEAELNEYFDSTLLRSFQGSAVSREALTEELKLIRKNGYAICDGEYVSGVFSLSFPVKSQRGAVYAFTLITPAKERKKILNPSVLAEISKHLKSYESPMPMF